MPSWSVALLKGPDVPATTLSPAPARRLLGHHGLCSDRGRSGTPRGPADVSGQSMVLVAAPRPGRDAATGPMPIALLAVLALLAQTLDLLTGLRMVVRYGVNAELNPLLRAALASAGPEGAAAVKLGAATLAVMFFVALAHAGRTRLARNCLLLAVDIGLVGVLSNGGIGALLPL